MKALERAIAFAEQIRDALEAEVAEARRQRLLIRTMDADGLFVYAQRREQFNARLAELAAELGRQIGGAATAFEIKDVTIAELSAHAPGLAQRLADRFAEVRALAGALHELDQLNRTLAERALTCVRAYVSALGVVPSVYDRRGGVSRGAPAPSSVATRVV